MLVRNVMTKHVTAANPNAFARLIAWKVLEGQFSGLPVVDNERKVIGVITEFDLIRAIEAGKDLDAIRAQEVMSSPAICVDIESSVDEAIDLMTKHSIIRLPVVKNGKLEGIVARCDILAAYLKDKVRQPFVEYEHFMTGEPAGVSYTTGKAA